MIMMRALCAFSLFAGVLGSVNVLSPNSSTTLSAGVVSHITWSDNGKAPSLKDFGPARISLCAGSSEKQMVLQVLAASVNVGDKSSAEFTVDPKVGPDSNLYLIRFDSLSSKNTVAFSSNFKLANMTGMFTTAPTSASGSKSVTKTELSSKSTNGPTTTPGGLPSVSGTGTDTSTETLTAPPGTITGISGNSTNVINGTTITASDANATSTLPAPCVGCVNITVIVLVTTAHDAPAPSPTTGSAMSIMYDMSLRRLIMFAGALAVPFAILA